MNDKKIKMIESILKSAILEINSNDPNYTSRETIDNIKNVISGLYRNKTVPTEQQIRDVITKYTSSYTIERKKGVSSRERFGIKVYFNDKRDVIPSKSALFPISEFVNENDDFTAPKKFPSINSEIGYKWNIEYRPDGGWYIVRNKDKRILSPTSSKNKLYQADYRTLRQTDPRMNKYGELNTTILDLIQRLINIVDKEDYGFEFN